MKKLNLGCGEIPKKGWINLDIGDAPHVDIMWDLNKKPYPFKDNSIDEIYSSCVLEHLKNLGVFVEECYRILKPKGKIVVKCDYAGYIFLYLLKRMEHNRLLQNNYKTASWHKKNINKDNHLCLFVPSHLVKLFGEFKEIKVTYPSPNRKKWKNFLLNSLPFKLGKQHIQITAIK